MNSPTRKRTRPPLDRQKLEQLALFYAGRYATTRARLRAYLHRKVKERGWSEGGDPDVDRLVERFVERGYVDDKAFASARAASLQRRGFGERRVAEALRMAGIEEEDSGSARQQARERAFETALRFARRRRLGPFSPMPQDPAARRKAFAAMIRAGHGPDIARQVLDSSAAELPDPDCM